MKQRDEHGRRVRGPASRDTANPEPQWLRQDREQRNREQGDPTRDYDYGSTWGVRGGYDDDHDSLDLGTGRNYPPFRVGTSTGLGGAPGSYGSSYGSRSGWDLGAHQREPAGPSFRGLGPQNYKRADERILDDIHERLTASHHIDARNILVDVQDGNVTLTGTVQLRRMRYAAEDLVESVMGVANIENQLKVQDENTAPPDDTEPH